MGTALGINVICCSTLEAITSFVLNYQSVRACLIDLKNSYIIKMNIEIKQMVWWVQFLRKSESSKLAQKLHLYVYLKHPRIYIWLELRKATSRVHNCKTHFSPSNDGCIY